MKNKYKLITRIIKLSQAKKWDYALLEWEIKKFYSSEKTLYSEERESFVCLCSHKPIYNITLIENKFNKNSAIIGSCCIKKFMGKDVEYWKKLIEKIKEDPTKCVNVELLEFVYMRGVIREKDLIFYLDTIRRKKKFSVKQFQYRIGLNKKIINYFQNMITSNKEDFEGIKNE